MTRPLAGGRRSPMTAGVAAPSDRRFRRPDIRPGRRRPAARVTRLLVRLVLPVVVLSLIGVWGARALMASDLLVVREVVVRGAHRLTRGDIEGLTDGLPGSSILRADLNHYRERLATSPWVSSVTASRLLPSTVVFKVQERRPVAVARLGLDLYLIDDSGVLVAADGPAFSDLDLPIVDGLSSTAPEIGSTVTNREGAAVVGDLLRAVAESPGLADRVSQVDASDAHNLAVLIDGDPAWLHVGEEAFVERLERYLEWAPALRERFNNGLDYVDLRFGERLVVRAGGRRTEWSKE